MADNNMKITDAGTITSMNGTDKVFVNSGDDLKQITLDNAVANSTPVKTLSSNLGIKGLQLLPKKTVEETFLTLNEYFAVFYNGGGSYTGDEFKGNQYSYGISIMIKRVISDTVPVGRIIIFPESANTKPIIKSWWSSNYVSKNSGWCDFDGNSVTP